MMREHVNNPIKWKNIQKKYNSSKIFSSQMQ